MMPWGPSTPTRRLVTWGAGRGPPRCLPSGERRLVQPQRQVAPPAKPEVVLPPVANPILGPRDAMLARGVELERHDGLAQRVDGAVRYPRPSIAPSLRAPTPLALDADTGEIVASTLTGSDADDA